MACFEITRVEDWESSLLPRLEARLQITRARARETTGDPSLDIEDIVAVVGVVLRKSRQSVASEVVCEGGPYELYNTVAQLEAHASRTIYICVGAVGRE
jgi:hypothetical protein